jgi:hypothetical protein
MVLPPSGLSPTLLPVSGVLVGTLPPVGWADAGPQASANQHAVAVTRPNAR